MNLSRPVIRATLGPTNTGKTHLAINRMLRHETGIIGLPLRLLAREVFDTVRALRGHSSVALVTGEERIVPKKPRYWICTTEAMPVGNGADFLAVDEIQLCADRERGHVFTNRLLYARGQKETVFLGADTISGVIRELVPSARFQYRKRFSSLSYAGSKRIDRLPSRSAVVGFSADEVYFTAEAIRRLRGGAAVVMGALSPRTRNAQVAMYQNGDVDFLVATDAIGMGLNLDLAHVAFSGLVKFDGRKVRSLESHELAQIAGRAGRFRRPGSFGVTGDCAQLSPGAVSSIEQSRFSNLRRVQWRNSALNFGSSNALLASLATASENPILVLTRESDDVLALKELSERQDIQDLLGSPCDVRLLWEVCQIPDFRNVSEGEHAALLSRIFRFLHDNNVIPDAWLEKQMVRLDRIDGDIETLSARIAFVRTWTYSAQKPGWVNDVAYWRNRTREVEDRLSDALHERLTQRFVDKRTSVLLRQLSQKEPMAVNVDDDGLVEVEGHEIGKIEGFLFSRKPGSGPQEERALKAASAQVLDHEYRLRAKRLSRAADKELDFTEQGGLMWGKAAIGKLVAGHDAYRPRLNLFVDDEAGAEVRQQVERRMQAFVDAKLNDLLKPLIELRSDEKLVDNVRGFAFRLVEQFGVLRRSTVIEEVKALDNGARKLLRVHGVRFGQFSIYVAPVIKPEATRLRLLLWSLANEHTELVVTPPPGLTTCDLAPEVPIGYYPICGFMDVGERAVRVDILERLMNLIRVEDTWNGFEASAEMLSITGMTHAGFAGLMQGLGYDANRGERSMQIPHPTKKDATEQTAEKAEGASSSETMIEKAHSPEVKEKADDAGQQIEGANAEGTEGDEGAHEESRQTVETTEVFYTFKWKPKPKRRFKTRRSRSTAKANPSQAPRKGRGPRPKKGEWQKRTRTRVGKAQSQRSRSRQRKIDPDNPFAALLSLHDRD